MQNEFLKDWRFVDLSHTITSSIPTWDKHCGFQQEVVLDYDQCTTHVKFRVQRFQGVNGIGTHIDAPAHCIPHGLTIDNLPLASLIIPCVIIDIRARATENYTVTIGDLEQFERDHGAIEPGILVAVNTGWDRFWQSREVYRNNLMFPSISVQAAKFLVERNIVGIAIDTLGVDCEDSEYPVHDIFLRHGIYILENATNLDKLPPVGAYVLALPIKIEGATEAPIRFVGITRE